VDSDPDPGGPKTCGSGSATLQVSSVYDWRLVVTGVGRERSAAERTFVLSTGRSRVFLYNMENGSWVKMEDKYRVELPRDTLLFAEVIIKR
jgi:hypothetical protein